MNFYFISMNFFRPILQLNGWPSCRMFSSVPARSSKMRSVTRPRSRLLLLRSRCECEREMQRRLNFYLYTSPSASPTVHNGKKQTTLWTWSVALPIFFSYIITYYYIQYTIIFNFKNKYELYNICVFILIIKIIF